MTTISGTLTESLDPTDWIAYAHRIDTGALAGLANVAAGAFSIDCGTVTEACLITVAPRMGARWKAGEMAAVGDYRVPSAPAATPYIYRAVAVGGGTDPHFQNVELGLRCNGANGSTAFTDLSNRNRAITAHNGAQISTARSRFGGASAFFDGTNDFLSVTPPSGDTGLQFGTGDFTIECWAFQTSPSDGNRTLWGFGESQPMRLLTSSGNLVLNHTSTGTVVISTTVTIGAVWKHVALVRSSGIVRLYVDGVQAGANWSFSGNLDLPAGGVFRVGCNRGDTWFWAGNIDDLRITKGVARYTANFTPPEEIGTSVSPTGSSEPAWPTTIGQEVIDGGVTWRCVSRMVQPITHGPLIPV
jgi:hypothetical protein